MSFISLIFKNPFRNKSRALLAIIGIGIGIATIIALGAITAGLTQTIDDTLHAGGADFSILSKESDAVGTPYGTATLDEEWLDKIQNISGVKNVEGVYIGMVPLENKPYSMLIGIDPKNDFNLSSMTMTLTKGRMIKDDSKEILAGKLTLEDLNKNVGDEITIKDQKFTIVGVFESGDPGQDNGLLTSIKDVQKLVDDTGKVSIISVFVDSGVDVNSITKKIDEKYGDDITTVTSITDIEMVAESLDMVNAASWGISLLAIVIGGIGVINTMIMSVYERTREIGVLKAVGWKRRRILGMILGESIVLTITAGVVGSIIGVVGIRLLASAGILGEITPVFTIEPFTQAFGVAIIVGLIGGFYPAWRASRLPPTEALRYE
ncbi:MAG: ABC transporter permease [Methanobacteriaceae archaeon]|jgi:putative ABC transport system permease protein|nr:ABC transporter permease [Candidatus Methanorudis spinitermitis]